MIKLPNSPNRAAGEKYYPCRLCGAAHTWVELRFTSGSTEPTDDETLTGATSAATCVVEEVTLTGGSWAGGDAEGYILGSAPSAIEFDTQHWGSSQEDINGSVAGDNCLTLYDYGYAKRFGRYYPEGEVFEADDGFRYCAAHYPYRIGFRDKDEYIPDIDDGDREG